MFRKIRIASNSFRNNGITMSANGTFTSLNVCDSPASVSVVHSPEYLSVVLS